MRSRALHLAVLAVLIVSAPISTLLLQDIDRRSGELLAGQDAGAARLAAMSDALAGIGAAQQSYVAPGQQAEPWFERMSALVQQLYDEMTAARDHLRSPEAAPTLEAVAASMEELLAADTRARENLRLGEALMAADVIFSDGRNTLETLDARVRALRGAEQTTFQAAYAALAGERWTVLGVTALVWLVGALSLVAMPRRRLPQAAVVPVEAQPAPLAGPPEIPLPPQVPQVDLAAAAALCTDLARMTTTEALAGMLGRAAAILDASGIIVWLGAGEELFAVAAHGYEPAMLARLSPLSRHDQNATAAAWRGGQLLTVAAAAGSSGAVVAPLFGPEGCIGVLTVEVRSGREHDSASHAVATMVAAQLATALVAWPAASTAPPSQEPEHAAAEAADDFQSASSR
jgi:hypothetical protein